MHKNDISEKSTTEISEATDSISSPVNNRYNRHSQGQSNFAFNLNTRYSQDDFADETEPCLTSKVPHNWQSSKTCIKERIEFMFNNETLADIHFIVGKGGKTQRIPAHKFVLSVGSIVFDAMFNGILATKSEEIELPDVEPAAFFALLR